METKETYRPANIEFDVNGGSMPQNLGFEFPTQQSAIAFMSQYLIGMQMKQRVSRFMDNFEKNEIRREYQELLEQKIPILEREMLKAKAAYDEAKKNLADSTEMVSATMSEAKALANEVRRGTKEMELDDMNTWRVPVGSKYYYYTWMDQEIKLARVLDIPFHEKTELFNATSNNEDFFLKRYPEGLLNEEAFNFQADAEKVEAPDLEAKESAFDNEVVPAAEDVPYERMNE